MSKRSNSVRAGDVSFPSNSLALLPRTHESVRQVSVLDAFNRSQWLVEDTYPLGVFTPSPRRFLGRVWSPPAPPRRFPRQRSFTGLRTLQIRVPPRVKFCIQRKERREVLFALGRAGFRGSAPKRRYRRTQNSQWRC